MTFSFDCQYNINFVCNCNGCERLLLVRFKYYLLNILADQHSMDSSLTDEKNLIDQSCTSTPQKITSYAGSYQLIRRIQIGGQASIYLAFKENQYFAIKVYTQGVIEDKSFENQVMILGRLDYKGLVPVTQAISNVTFQWENSEEKTVHIIVMPFIQNGDLFQWVSKYGSFSQDSAKYFAKKLIGTFRYLVSQYVYHRDIKPQNILLNEHYQPLILDFGLSIDSRHKANNFVSDVRFASPEVIKRAEYTEKSEIYSIGILLFYILTGHHPFVHARISDPNYRCLVQRKPAIFWQNMEQKVKKQFSPSFKQLFLSMICHNPINRPNFDNIMEYSWLRGGEPTLQEYQLSMANMTRHPITRPQK